MKLFSASRGFFAPPLFLIIIGLLLLLLSFSHQIASAPQSAFCRGKCKVRCSKAGMRDRCLDFCGICCAECSCVPSGTYGHKDECPCYRDKYTGEGTRRRPKCP